MGKELEQAAAENQNEKKKKRLRLTVAALCVAGAAAVGAGVSAVYTTGYSVEYQGSTIAYVANKDALASAVVRAEALTSDLLDTDYSFGQDLQIKSALVPRDSVAPLTEATTSLLEQVPELTQVFSLTVDGKAVGAAEKADDISRALERVKESYRTAATVDLAIESEIGVSRTFQARDEKVLTEDELVQALSAPVTRVFPYTTQAGDTMESVARTFAMDPQRLEELNDSADLEIAATDTDIAALDEILGETAVTGGEPGVLDPAPAADPEKTLDGATDTIDPADIAVSDPEALAAEAVREAYAAVDAAQAVTTNEEDLVLTEAPLTPGQTIAVEQTCSLLVVAAVEEQVTDRTVDPEKLTLLDSTLPMGTQEVLVEGKAGSETVLTRVTKRCGVPVSATDLSSVTRQKAEPLLVAVGYGSHPELYDFFSVGDIMFQWPVRGSISSDYGYRHIFGGLNFHRGIDIPAPMGTAVHAAADGTVTFAGVKGSYGNLVIIDHGNGFETLYGHNSGFLVKAGDVVTKGQTIAAVGSTGRSTGPHCHFEVHLNGELVDPLMYLPGENNAPARLQIPLSDLNQAVEEGKEPAETGGSESPAPAQQPAGNQTPASQPAPAPTEPTQPAETDSQETGEAGETPSEAEAPAETAPAETTPLPEPPAPTPETPVSDALGESLMAE